MSVVELQTVSLPPGEAGELRQMIALELDSREEDSPREFDYFENVGAAAGTADTAPLTVLSVSRETGLGLAESLLKTGLACETLETLPCILGQAVNMVDPRARQGAVIALDWGGLSPTLTLVSQGEPVFSRPLRKCGLQSFVLSAAAQFECSIPECYELLALCQGRNLLQETPRSNLQQVMLQCAQPVILQLQQELKKTLDYLKQEYPKVLPERLWLFGGGALIPGITERLREMSGLDTRLWHLPTSNPATETDPWQAVFGAAATLSILGAPS
jgi:Tfp pilus assembly PilM family ATPase